MNINNPVDTSLNFPHKASHNLPAGFIIEVTKVHNFSGPLIKMYVNKKYRICTFSTVKNQDKNLTYTKLNLVT